MNRACFPKKKTPEFTKMGEIHELFVLAVSLVWFAGATPESRGKIAYKNPIKLNERKQLLGIVPGNAWGVKSVYVVPFSGAKRETHKQRSPRRSLEIARTALG